MGLVGNIKGPAGAAGPTVTQGTYSARPSASTAGAGACYFASDVGVLFLSNGSAWAQVGHRSVIVNPAEQALNNTTTINMLAASIPSGIIQAGTIIRAEVLASLNSAASTTIAYNIAAGSLGTSVGANTTTASNGAYTGHVLRFTLTLTCLDATHMTLHGETANGAVNTSSVVSGGVANGNGITTPTTLSLTLSVSPVSANTGVTIFNSSYRYEGAS